MPSRSARRTEHGGADAAQAESEAEEKTRDRAHAARHQLLREHEDGRERRGEDQSDEHAQDARSRQTDIRQSNVKGATPEDRKPNDTLAPDAVADGSAEESAERDRQQEQEQMNLRRLNRQVKFLDEIEAVIARDAREVEILGEQQHQQDGDRPGDAAPGDGAPVGAWAPAEARRFR